MRGLRVGNGFDAHRLVAGRPLHLGGVEVPRPLTHDLISSIFAGLSVRL